MMYTFGLISIVITMKESDCEFSVFCQNIYSTGKFVDHNYKCMYPAMKL